MKKYKMVDEFLADQDAKKLDQIMLLRDMILKAEPTLVETLKWNAPNYEFRSEDRITFNLMNVQNKVKIILHMGTAIKEDKKGKPVLDDSSGLIEWNSNIRGTITFDDVADIKAKSDRFTKIIKDWLSIS